MYEDWYARKGRDDVSKEQDEDKDKKKDRM